MQLISVAAKEPKVGFISDIHGNIKAAKAVVKHLQRHPVDILVLGGDTTENTKANTRTVLSIIAKAGIPTIIYPGSHENSFIFGPVVKELTKKSQFYDGMQDRTYQLGSFELVIVPGSSVLASGRKAYYGGNYRLFEETDRAKLIKDSKKIKAAKVARKIEPAIMSRTEKQFSSKIPSTRRILFTHDPPRFSGKSSIDVAHFATSTEEFSIEKKHTTSNAFKKLGLTRAKAIRKGAIIMLAEGKVLAAAGYPVKVMKKNVGTTSINDFMKRHKITKTICGHIHEAGPRAITTDEFKAKQKTAYKKLHINNGTGFSGNYTELLLHKNGMVSYQFIKLDL